MTTTNRSFSGTKNRNLASLLLSVKKDIPLFGYSGARERIEKKGGRLMFIETAQQDDSAMIIIEVLSEKFGVGSKDHIDTVRHEIENCVASIKMVNYMLLEPDVSEEDRKTLRNLSTQSAARLAELVEGAGPGMALYM